jgi:hypothetical protein
MPCASLEFRPRYPVGRFEGLQGDRRGRTAKLEVTIFVRNSCTFHSVRISPSEPADSK